MTKPLAHWLEPVLGWAALVCALGPVLAAAQATGTRQVDDPVYVAPVKLVAIENGRRLNLYCIGSGVPTVVFVSGIGDSTRAWALVQPEIAKHTRACSYDRAGLGFSDPAEVAATASNAVRDLAALLTAADIPGPNVLVGHSYGGMVAKLFASRYRSAVSGLVLVDPSHEDVGRAIFALDPGSRAKNTKYLLDLQRCLQAGTEQLSSDPELDGLCVDQPDARFSERLNAAARERALQASQVAAWISEMTNIWTQSADQVRQEARSFGSLPVIVLTKEPARPAPGETAEMRERKNLALSLQHEATARLSSRGRRIVVRDSGHYIQFDQPSAVIEAILEVLQGQVASPTE